MFSVNWSEFKTFVDDRSLSVQYTSVGNYYIAVALDGGLCLHTRIRKTSPANSDQSDFETNYKPSGNQKLGIPTDADGSPLSRAKVASTGWHYQLHGIEFETSQLDSVYSKKEDGTNFGFSVLKCYDSGDVELTSQANCDTSAVKTVLDWEPTYDYEIIGGMLKQKNAPISDVRLWVIGVPDVPEASGGNKIFAASVNLAYVGLEEGVEVDGRAPKFMSYDSQYHTNKLRLVLKHDAGVKHKLTMIFEIFKE